MLSDMTLQYIQIQIPLNAYIFKYKYVGKYFKYFSLSGYITIWIKEKKLYIEILRHVVFYQ